VLALVDLFLPSLRRQTTKPPPLRFVEKRGGYDAKWDFWCELALEWGHAV
jgi:hypothetical protein